MMKSDFVEFQKIPRLMREVVVTEKIDGTNAQIEVLDNRIDAFLDASRTPENIIVTVGDYSLRAGSRARWITPDQDNHEFAAWVINNAEELVTLGAGRHFGEWWGKGINRNYGLAERRFSLFNTRRWGGDGRPRCCEIVPVLWTGLFDTNKFKDILYNLTIEGSVASPGFMKPEGVVYYHVPSGFKFKQTIERDEEWKGKK